MAKPDEEAPTTEAQPTAAAKGTGGANEAKAQGTNETTSAEEQAPEPLPPTESGEGENVAFTPQWLIDNSQAVLGVPVQVASGALANAEEEFLTPEQAKSKIDAWLETPVEVDTADGEEG